MIITEYQAMNAEVGATQPQDRVKLDMSRVSAVQLFHDINRLLALLDELCPNLQDEMHPDGGDQEAYDRTNGVLGQLQRELRIDPTGG